MGGKKLLCSAGVAGLALCAFALRPSVALGDEQPAVEPDVEPSADRSGGPSGLEITADMGLLSRMSTGIGEPLRDYGYDHGPAPAFGGTARLLFGDHRYMRWGLTAHGQHARGRRLGRGGYGFASTLTELGLTLRAKLPCMSSGNRQVHLAGTAALSGAYYDAGRGLGPMNRDVDARREAAARYDHYALGWKLGVDASVHFGRYLIGLEFTARQHFGIDTAIDRHFAPSIMLRTGAAFDWH